MGHAARLKQTPFQPYGITHERQLFPTLAHSIGSEGCVARAFMVVPIYGIAWIIFYRESFSWASIATLATWFMTLLIQRAAHRDTQAIHAKLDELLRAQSEARTELAAIDQQDPEEIEEHRRTARAID